MVAAANGCFAVGAAQFCYLAIRHAASNHSLTYCRSGSGSGEHLYAFRHRNHAAVRCSHPNGNGYCFSYIYANPNCYGNPTTLAHTNGRFCHSHPRHSNA